MQALKALVIFMGLLIVIGAGAVAVTLYQRLTAPDFGTTADDTDTTMPAAARLPAFGARDLALPRGAEIEEMTAEGDRLIVRLRLADGTRRLLVVDLTDGRLLGTLTLEAGAREAGP